jgi:SSS family solute:Na+ symporter
MMDVFAQLQLTWVFGVLFAAPFWIGMYWRGATRAAAWTTVAFCALAFFAIPFAAPRVYPALRTVPAFLVSTERVQVITERKAAPTDVAKRAAEIKAWEEQHPEVMQIADAAQRAERERELGKPAPLVRGEIFADKAGPAGGDSVFWEKLAPVNDEGQVDSSIKPVQSGEAVVDPENPNVTTITLAYPKGTKLAGQGNFKLDFLLYQLVGVDFSTMSSAMLATLELPPKIITPFLVMILISLVTPKCAKEGLDRYYVKMKTPVLPHPKADQERLEAAYKEPEKLEHLKLLPGSSLEFQKPRTSDVVGFVLSVLACFGIIGLAMLVASIGA